MFKNKKRTSHSQRLISNTGLLAINEHLLKNPHHSAAIIKTELVLVSSTRSITRYCNKLNWKKIRTRYCQIVSSNNRIKRYVFCVCCRIYKEDFGDTIHADECSIEIRRTSIKIWYKQGVSPSNGKVGKPKHSLKLHLWGAISRRGLSNLVIFEGKLDSPGYCNFCLRLGLMPFLDQFPDGHRYWQDGDPKHTSAETIQFMHLNGINYFPTPPESPDLNPMEMVWNDLKYFLCTKVQPSTKNDLINGVHRFWNEKKTI